MGARGQPTDPPYRRIAAELRERIASGEVRAGEKVPSTRRIAQEWGVATATAAKVLAVLRQEGLVRAVPGVGTVVRAPGAVLRPEPAARTARRRARQRTGEPALSRERVVRTAVAIADAYGSAALSMRALAAELGVSTVALYRHVPGKDELVVLMADAVLGEAELPARAPADWRGRLEAAAGSQWALYCRHPWLAKVMSPVRPLPSARADALARWAMEPLRELGLGSGELTYIAVTWSSFVRGLAVNLEDAAEGGRVLDHAGGGPGLDAMFAFGLARLLDGLEPVVARAGAGARPRPEGRGRESR
ncbi:GntR family transcriptional regulator [Streptomyces griseocarneus]|uniref:GntR family transcriptional regulator n=1 Tax=Streptomyces griseocarneus TaxID=51201 RepID=UPI00167D6887|nr:GntR family transcriptional regulator [Streptomyces griseocarneus]MBZ6473638.1 GntR family transcriptional regulator [Streptomyces griseocarneus]